MKRPPRRARSWPRASSRGRTHGPCMCGARRWAERGLWRAVHLGPASGADGDRVREPGARNWQRGSPSSTPHHPPRCPSGRRPAAMGLRASQVESTGARGDAADGIEWSSASHACSTAHHANGGLPARPASRVGAPPRARARRSDHHRALELDRLGQDAWPSASFSTTTNRTIAGRTSRRPTTEPHPVTPSLQESARRGAQREPAKPRRCHAEQVTGSTACEPHAVTVRMRKRSSRRGRAWRDVSTRVRERIEQGTVDGALMRTLGAMCSSCAVHQPRTAGVESQIDEPSIHGVGRQIEAAA